ncbi:unnamed protein product, partial [Urochloa humidicola]
RRHPEFLAEFPKPHAAPPSPPPHPHRPPSGGGMEAGGEEFAIGVVISAKTTLGEEFEGQIVAFDRPSNLLVIHILLESLAFLAPIWPPPCPLLTLPVVRIVRVVCFVSMTA